ncbi:Signal transduction histidine kinase [Anaerovirgula multivorans]|uniref:histidine kinase n=1 Tax=Anaerovirgula multivorans TaxID=312168 RepID=A0A239BFU3_9FIRM|nr:ATP-binding protein [Anaerovirgula multivorans]SNS06790.1 Signal transduction histidine kinase [Anaerovirgula multivorans]
MINKLRTRLILLILGGAIFSIILVSVITNITLFGKFDLYMRDEQENKLGEVIQLIEQSYVLNNGWTDRALDNIRISPIIYSFDIEIRDQDNHLIFSEYMENAMIRMHSEMSARMGHGMMRRNHSNMVQNNLRDENYTIEEYALTVNNERVGTVSIGHIGPFLVSEREIEFARGMNTSIFYGAIISILAAILLGMYSTKIFSKPILQITEAANSIREGKLNDKVELNSSIVELQELSQSINHLATSLSEQELLRKRLTSDISHELRTPLTILQTHIEAMRDGVWEPTQDKLEICNNEVLRLIRLVEELKHLTDIENHKLTLEIQQYALSKDLTQIIESFRYSFQEKRIQLNADIQEKVQVYGDRDKIRQVLINIISNALKFTNPEGKVSVVLTADNNQIVITIEDTGIGLDEKDLPYIFERFYRSDLSRNRKTGGAGIGLAIAKNLIEAHGGKITAESKKNEGTKFTVLLPQKS